jgi:nucleoside-diphosphate-sugar epimerase
MVTGATGFVGSAIILELLVRSEVRIIGIVRGQPGQSPTERLQQTLHTLVDAYAYGHETHRLVAERVSAWAGDVWEPRCGVTERGAGRVTEFWHCAASLQYMDRYKTLIERTNVEGTRHALELARFVDAGCINMVSTAYVVGDRRGHLHPEPGDHARVNNHYEHSKVSAERIVQESGLPVRIMRPGIVVGHSRTRHALNYNGMYGFLRGLMKFRGALERTQPGLSEQLQVKVRADAEGLIGLVPVDSVAEDCVGLSLCNAPPGIYHVTNGTPPSVSDAIETCFRVAGLCSPMLVRDSEELGALDHKLQKRIDFYRSYIVNPKHFDRSATDRLLGASAGTGCALPVARLTSFCTWYRDLIEREQAERPVLR